MDNYTVWYEIDHPDYPHCKAGQILMGGLPQRKAEILAANFAAEIMFITGLTADEINAWID